MPLDLLGYLLLADVVAINIGISLVLAALASDEWLRSADSTWSDAARAQGRLACRAGLVVLLIGLVCAVWFQAAVMGDAPLWQTVPTVWVLLRDTHFGHVALAGWASWCLVAAASWAAEPHERVRHGLGGLALAALVWSRSAVSHAGSQGDVSFDVAIDGVHLLAACLWVGMVLLAASLRLPAIGAPTQQRFDAIQWVASLSSTATLAFFVVLVTGLFKVWRTSPDFTALVTSGYGLTLGSKVALVGVAGALGGFNRFRVLPSLFASLRTDSESQVKALWRDRLKAVLRVEAVVLCLVLFAAAVLAGTELPGALQQALPR